MRHVYAPEKVTRAPYRFRLGQYEVGAAQEGEEVVVYHSDRQIALAMQIVETYQPMPEPGGLPAPAGLPEWFRSFLAVEIEVLRMPDMDVPEGAVP